MTRSDIPARIDLPRDQSAPALARRFIKDVCRTVGMDDVASAVLVTSELVTNAFRHTFGGFHLTWLVEPPTLVVCVFDSRRVAVTVPSGPIPTTDLESGRGLYLAALSADSLSCHLRDDGKYMCATFQLPPRMVLPSRSPEGAEHRAASGPAAPRDGDRRAAGGTAA